MKGISLKSLNGGWRGRTLICREVDPMREFWKELDRVPGTFIAGDIVHDTKGKIYTVFPSPTKFPGSLTIAEAEELYKQGKLQSIADDEGYILHFPK